MYEFLGKCGPELIKLRNPATGEIRICPSLSPDAAWAGGAVSMLPRGGIQVVWSVEEATGRVFCKLYQTGEDGQHARAEAPVAHVGDIPGYVRDPSSEPVWTVRE